MSTSPNMENTLRPGLSPKWRWRLKYVIAHLMIFASMFAFIIPVGLAMARVIPLYAAVPLMIPSGLLGICGSHWVDLLDGFNPRIHNYKYGGRRDPNKREFDRSTESYSWNNTPAC